MKRKLRSFPGLSADAFTHPSDEAALRALKAIPALDKAVAKVMEYGFERIFYLDNVASNIRVTDKMFPRLHRSLIWPARSSMSMSQSSTSRPIRCPTPIPTVRRIPSWF